MTAAPSAQPQQSSQDAATSLGQHAGGFYSTATGDARMSMSNLSLAALGELGLTIATLHDVGAQLEKAGFGPVSFDLTPGAAIEIRTRAVMPEAGVSIPHVVSMSYLMRCDPELGKRLRAEHAEYAGIMAPEPQSTEVALDPCQSGDLGVAAPGQVDPPAVDLSAGGPIPSVDQNEQAGAVPDARAAHREEVAAPVLDVAEVSSGGQELASPASPAAPVPGSASALAAGAGQWVGVWSAEQDAVVIDEVVAARINGTPKAHVLRDLSDALGRSFKAVEQRAYRLSAKIAAEEHRRRNLPPVPIIEDEPMSDDDKARIDAAWEAHKAAAPAAVPEPDVAKAFDRGTPSPPSDLHGKDLDLWYYLTDPLNRPRWPMTVGADLDLVMGLGRGDKLDMISADLGIDAAKLKTRFAVLSRPVQDDQGRPTIDGMPRLVKVLRLIAKSPVGDAS